MTPRNSNQHTVTPQRRTGSSGPRCFGLTTGELLVCKSCSGAPLRPCEQLGCSSWCPTTAGYLVAAGPAHSRSRGQVFSELPARPGACGGPRPARARTSDRGAATPRPHHVACSMGFDPAPEVRGRAPEARGGGLQLRHWAALEPQEWPPGGRTTGRSSRHVECSRPRSAPGGRAACPDAWAGCRVEIAASRDLAMTGRGGGPTQEVPRGASRGEHRSRAALRLPSAPTVHRASAIALPRWRGRPRDAGCRRACTRWRAACLLCSPKTSVEP